jgi:hypothetical protein
MREKLSSLNLCVKTTRIFRGLFKEAMSWKTEITAVEIRRADHATLSIQKSWH